jgi:hypothetical protein
VLPPVREYKRTVPALENQSLADLLPYVKAQQPNIELDLTRAAVGNPSVQEETAISSATAFSATGPTMYTQTQVQALLTAGRRARTQAKIAGRHQLCFTAGYMATTNLTLLSTAEGARLEPACSRDTATAMTTGASPLRANCQHDPPCIRSADAKRATKPESYPETPGSTYEWRALRGAAATTKRMTSRGHRQK